MTLYLDHAATSPLRPQARDAFLRACEIGANASSIHGPGRKAKVLMEDARTTILERLNAIGAADLVFTSGGTEANALALHHGDIYDYIVISEGEHDSVYITAEETWRETGLSAGKPVVKLPLTRDGQADLDALPAILDRPGYAFVALMLANNETGVINDIARAAQIVHAHNGWLHVDAVQALGKIAIDFEALGADSLSLSAHKVGGPQGVGALVHERGRFLEPLLIGGGQERGLRAGTENVPGIAAFAAAVDACHGLDKAVQAAQADIESRLRDHGIEIMGEGAPRVPGILCLAQPHWTSMLQLIHLDMAGIATSAGSACSSGKVKASRVVTAMGRPDLADKVLRLSAGWTTQPGDWLAFWDVWRVGYIMASRGEPVKEKA